MDPAPEPINHVRLQGKVSAEPVERTLPSGDSIMTFNLVVPRPPRRRQRGSKDGTSRDGVTVDTIECVAWTAALRRSTGRLAAGAQVEVTGSLRRRFQRTGGGVVSFTSVEIEACSRLTPTS